jgi:hypothetical protein
MRAVQSMKLPDQPGGSVEAFSAQPSAARLLGTVDATVQPIAEWSYCSLSEDWIRQAPMAAGSDRAPLLPRVRAKDLIAELDSINAQIHHMMFQVERAVSRLATSG